MKLLVLVDNATYIDVDVMGEPGVSIYLEDGDQRILFDMGITDLFLKNAEFFGVDLSGVTQAALSHGHYDHIRGLTAWVRQPYAKTIPLIAHPDCFRTCFEGKRDIGSPFSAQELAKRLPLRLTREPVRMSRHIVYLGEIPRVTDFEEGRLGDDPLPDDTALACETKDGLFLITGCSHSGICNIMERSEEVCREQRIAGVLGGFHLFGRSRQLEKTIEYFETNGIRNLYPCHCVDFEAKAAIHSRIPIHEVASGFSIELD
jgi:7,8-dihydropterin-6-yl-methyl-4-(beta-D-ribofuranosyl)aminobenzene 5'-phosphate synthase